MSFLSLTQSYHNSHIFHIIYHAILRLQYCPPQKNEVETQFGNPIFIESVGSSFYFDYISCLLAWKLEANELFCIHMINMRLVSLTHTVTNSYIQASARAYIFAGRIAIVIALCDEVYYFVYLWMCVCVFCD